MPPSPPVGGEGWGEAGVAPVTPLVPEIGAHQPVHVAAVFCLRPPMMTQLTPKRIAASLP